MEPFFLKSCYLFKQSIQLRNHSPTPSPPVLHNPSIDPHQSISVSSLVDLTHMWKQSDTVITVRGTLIRFHWATLTVRILKLFIKTSREKTSSSHRGSITAGNWRSNKSVLWLNKLFSVVFFLNHSLTQEPTFQIFFFSGTLSVKLEQEKQRHLSGSFPHLFWQTSVDISPSLLCFWENMKRFKRIIYKKKYNVGFIS